MTQTPTSGRPGCSRRAGWRRTLSSVVAAVATRLPSLLALAMVLVVYYPIVGVYFDSDDFADMVMIENRGFAHFFWAPFGFHMRFGRNVVEYLLYKLFGLHSELYLAVALVTHLANVILLMRIARKFTGSDWLAALGGAIWGTTPLLLGALGWYSVYPHVEACILLLLALDQIAAQANAETGVTVRTAVLCSLFLLAASTFFGVGIGMAMAAPVALLLLTGRPRSQRVLTLALAPLPPVVAALYLTWRFFYAKYEHMPALEQQVFTLGVHPIWRPPVMLIHLVGVGILGVLKGFAFSPATYPQSGVPLIGAYLIAVLGAYLHASSGDRGRILGVVVFTLSIYGIIALGRANPYAMFNVPPVESAKQERYHYTGTLLLSLLAVLALAQGLRRIKSRRFVEMGIFGAWACVSAYSYVKSGWRIDTYPTTRAYVASVLRDIDARIDAQPAGSNVYLPNPPPPPFMTGAMLSYDEIPGWAALFVLVYPENEVRGRRVYFVEPPEVGGHFVGPENRRFSTLLVSSAGEQRPLSDGSH